MQIDEVEVARIAKGLTEAQRQWLLSAGYIDPNTLRALRRRQLLAIGIRGLSPLGEAVRKHLERQP